MEASWSHIAMICEQDSTCIEKFKAVLIKEFPTERAKFLQAASEKDYKEMVQIVHKVKHKFSILKMHSAYTYSVSYEEELKEQNNKGEKQYCLYLDQLIDFLGIAAS